MEKLKPKHDHKLTDIIKVAIFGLMLLLPFISWMPNAFYYGFNEHAVVGQEEQYYNFYQGVKNGKPNTLDFIHADYGIDVMRINQYKQSLYIETEETNEVYFHYDLGNFTFNESDIFFLKLTASSDGEREYNFKLNTTDDYGAFASDITIGDYMTTYTSFMSLDELDSNKTANYLSIYVFNDSEEQIVIDIKNIQLFNLTQIFGSGNEPTKEQFENMLKQEYYNYGNNYVLKERGTNITWSMYNSWEDIWQTPLFSWTNNSILKTGLNAFCSAFGIVDTSYITNFLVYELVIVAIYIVLDIVLTLFKWLTHIGQKE